jgi:hypothetical protein
MPEVGGRVDWHAEDHEQTMLALGLSSKREITRALNDAGIPCPSTADPRRNPHRTGARRTLRTVSAILANPRYTGRQVWNRQRTDFDLVDPANTGLGHRQVQRWNLPEGWVISKASLASGADQRGRLHRRPGHRHAAWPGRPGRPPVSAGWVAGVRAVRAQAGVSLVQWQARLPVPSRLRQRHPPRSGPAEEHLRP